jgi:hypothetical protein
MNASRPDILLACPDAAEIEGLRRVGVDIMALATPWAMKVAHGYRAADNRFESYVSGERWLAFERLDFTDIVFWHRPTNRLTTWCGRTFALGEEVIDDPATYSFDCALNIFADPLEWLRARRDGIVVLPSQWHRAFERLRDAPRIAIAESLLPTYRRFMKPAHMPELSIIPSKMPPARRAA